jgi:hypothetical protein
LISLNQSPERGSARRDVPTASCSAFWCTAEDARRSGTVDRFLAELDEMASSAPGESTR